MLSSRTTLGQKRGPLPPFVDVSKKILSECSKSLIRASIAEASAQGIQDLGKVMKLVMPKVSGRSDGKRVNELAKALLSD